MILVRAAPRSLGLVIRQHAPTQKDQGRKRGETIALLETELSIRFHLTEALEFGFGRDVLIHVGLIFSAEHASFLAWLCCGLGVAFPTLTDLMVAGLRCMNEKTARGRLGWVTEK